MTAASAAGSPRSAGRCTSTPCPAAGRDPTRRRSPPSPASSSGSPTAPSCCSTDWSPRRPPRCSCPTRAGCAWSCSCTCRSVTARRITRSTTPGRGNARSCRPPLPSSRPARGPSAGCWSCTGCPPTGCTSPSPPSTLPTSRPRAAAGEALLCVAAVTFDKGHDVLLDALATISDLSWHCVCVGSLDRDPAFVEGLRRRSLEGGLDDRVHFPGPRTGADLDRSYAAADLMVLASRAETYGMVVTEALARGVPVLAADVGGVTEALGHGADGIRPGLLVPPEDPAALGAALRAWLGDAELRCAVAPGRSRAARVALRVVDDRVGDRRRPGRRVTMTVEGTRVSTEWLALREPADAAARARDLVEHLGRTPPATGRWVIHDLGCGTGAMGRWLAPLLPGPQHWVMHDRDADLLEVAAADPPGPAADGAAVTVETRHSDITRLQRGRSRRREPHHRLGAAGHADRGRVGRAGHRLRRRGMPGAADPVRRRPRLADPGGSTGPPRGRRVRCPPAPRDRARPPARPGCGRVRRRGVRPTAAPRSSSGPAPGDSAPRTPTWRRSGSPGGWVRRASSRSSWPPRPTAIRADVWRRQEPDSSRSQSTTPTCWSCRDGQLIAVTPRTAGHPACARPFAPSSPDSGRSRRTDARRSAPARSRSRRTGGAAGPCPGCC